MRYISLVNLIANKEVVKELVADGMTVENVRRELGLLLPSKQQRAIMLEEYEKMVHRLGEPGAPANAAHLIYSYLNQ